MANRNNIEMLKIKEMILRDKEAEIYDKLISTYQHHVEIDSIIEKLNPKEGEIILDLGCGTGRIAHKLISAGCKVVGLDFSIKSLKVCRTRCSVGQSRRDKICLIRADACNLPFEDDSFDKCISSQVLQHIPSENERLKMLYEVRRVLKRNGKFVLTTYNYSLRKIVGRKKETTKNVNLYAYRYDFIELKKTISSVFKGNVKIVGILNLNHWLPRNMLNAFETVFAPFDRSLEKTPFCYFLAHLLLVECKKI